MMDKVKLRKVATDHLREQTHYQGEPHETLGAYLVEATPRAVLDLMDRIETLESELREIVIFTRVEGIALRQQELAHIESLVGPVQTPRV